MGHLLGYARVSTTDQHPQLQIDALQRAGCYRVFTETASGARTDRPTLEQLLDQLRPGDTLVVWKLDRLGRSLRHLVDTVTGLADRGIGFRSLQEAIDTTTPGGKLVFHVFAALAEFERDLIRERTSAGLAAARARGRHGGRPSVLTGHKAQVAQEMYASGQYTVAAIANTLGVSRASIYRHLTGPDRRVGEERTQRWGWPKLGERANEPLLDYGKPHPFLAAGSMQAERGSGAVRRNVDGVSNWCSIV